MLGWQTGQQMDDDELERLYQLSEMQPAVPAYAVKCRCGAALINEVDEVLGRKVDFWICPKRTWCNFWKHDWFDELSTRVIF